jgi:hypothetical protein
MFLDWTSIHFTQNSLKDYVLIDPWWRIGKKGHQVKRKEQETAYMIKIIGSVSEISKGQYHKLLLKVDNV